MTLIKKALNPSLWCEVLEISPEEAKTVLEGNTFNRDVSSVLVKSMASDMIKGSWKLNGDSIKFASNGRLVDGQHRLSAIVESGETLKTFVCGGMDFSTFDTLDIGKKRALRDLMKISGVKHYVTAAAATKWLIKLDTDGEPARQIRMKEPEQLEYYTERADDIQEAIRAINNLKLSDDGKKSATLSKSLKIQCSEGLAIALYYRFAKFNADRTQRFFHFWNDASLRPDMAGTSPVAILAQALAERNMEMMRIGGRFHDMDRLIMIVTTWNAWIRGEKLSSKMLNRINVQHPTMPAKWPGILGPKIDESQLELD